MSDPIVTQAVLFGSGILIGSVLSWSADARDRAIRRLELALARRAKARAERRLREFEQGRTLRLFSGEVYRG